MATLTKVASGVSAVAGVSQMSSRDGLVIMNDDANRLYVLLGDNGTVSATNYSFSLAQNESAFLPNCEDKCTLIWAGDGSGFAYITEYDS